MCLFESVVPSEIDRDHEPQRIRYARGLYNSSRGWNFLWHVNFFDPDIVRIKRYKHLNSISTVHYRASGRLEKRLSDMKGEHRDSRSFKSDEPKNKMFLFLFPKTTQNYNRVLALLAFVLNCNAITRWNRNSCTEY